MMIISLTLVFLIIVLCYKWYNKESYRDKDELLAEINPWMKWT